jgi:hypothetical protein
VQTEAARDYSIERQIILLTSACKRGGMADGVNEFRFQRQVMRIRYLRKTYLFRQFVPAR